MHDFGSTCPQYKIRLRNVNGGERETRQGAGSDTANIFHVSLKLWGKCLRGDRWRHIRHSPFAFLPHRCNHQKSRRQHGEGRMTLVGHSMSNIDLASISTSNFCIRLRHTAITLLVRIHEEGVLSVRLVGKSHLVPQVLLLLLGHTR